MLTFENFQSIFKRAEAKPYWVLYKGQGKGVQIGSNLQHDGRPDIDEALADLTGVIELYGDGVYTVEQRYNPTATRGTDLHVFIRGEASAPAKVAGTQAVVSHPMSSFFHGLDARYFIDQSNRYQSDLHAAQLENMRLLMQIESLKRERKEKVPVPGIGERIIGVMENNPGIIERLLGAGATTAIGTLKAQKPIPANPNQPDEDDEEDLPIGQIDLNALVDAANRIQQHIDSHVNDLLYRLADFIEKNPAQAKNLLSMLP